MPDPDTGVVFYWPSVSSRRSDGSLSFRLTGSEGDCRFTGSFPVAVEDPDFAFWSWVHEHRHALPAFFEERYVSSLRHGFLEGRRSFVIPPDGLYVVLAGWSGPAKLVEKALLHALETCQPSLPVRFLDTDSHEIEATFPQMRPFLHGWGEIFEIREGRCQLFLAPGRHRSSIPQVIDHLLRSLRTDQQ